jgi:hypothetical protein
MPDQPLKEVAFYYPGHLWSFPEWVKTLLLFFDGVGLLVPEYKQHEPEHLDPSLATPLRDQGLLHYLIADEVVDGNATEQLATAITTLMSNRAFDGLRDETTAFHAISMSRMGYFGNRKLAEGLFHRLKELGLAKESEDDVSIPLHPAVRYTILVLLAQILRPHGSRFGLDLTPATDQPELVQGLTELLNVPSSASSGHVVAFDLQNVSVDLSRIPLDEVLGFRKEHLREHRNYIKSVRQFARELSLMNEEERSRAFEERQAELDDTASDLRKLSRKAWKRPASFSLALAGASWRIANNDPLGALLAASNALLGLKGESPLKEAGVYSYLFAANRRFA